MAPLEDWALKFVRWGLGLASLGLLGGLVPLGHYLLDDAIPSCPSAPVHGHVVLLSLIGMPMFGLLYRALPSWSNGESVPLPLVRAHFRLSVAAILGVFVNGEVVYEVLTHVVQPGFYYAGDAGQAVRNIWFGIDGAFLALYGIGCAIFLRILVKATSYSRDRQQAGT